MKLEKGEIICPECNGTGDPNYTKVSYNNFLKIGFNCEKCDGTGKLDWIENVVGKELSDHEKNKEELKKILNSGNWKLTMGN